MKVPWRKKIEIDMDDQFLKLFIKDLLGDSDRWEYRSMFQHLTIKKKIVNPAVIRLDIFGWLKRRT